jgi:quercetin dioxygenase-like cupin family protein
VTETRPHPISIDTAIAALTFLSDRTPATTAEESSGAFALLSDYRDGGVFVGHWAGSSEWERHSAGDEIVMVVDGETTITFLAPNGEQSSRLRAGDFVVVPRGTWHRFETPHGVKVLSVTPQPTDHRVDRPG